MDNFKEKIIKKLKEMTKEARQDVPYTLETRKKIANKLLRKKGYLQDQ